MNKFFAANESLVASELWDLLSGQQNTMEEILEIINTISTTAFLEKFQFLTDNANRITPEYRNQLTEWNLHSELELINSNTAIIQNIATNKTLTRIYNNSSFDGKGNYNWDRHTELLKLF